MIEDSLDWPATRVSCFDYRIGLEGEAAASAARYRKPVDLVRIRRALDRHAALNASCDFGLSEDFDFHLCIAQASRNQFYVGALLAMKAELFEAIALARASSGFRTAEKFSAICRQHGAIYLAIQSRDPDAARCAMRSHLSRCKNSTRHWDASDRQN